jgi:hypothetical protein
VRTCEDTQGCHSTVECGSSQGGYVHHGFNERLAVLVADPVGSTPQEFASYIRNEYAKYGKVIKTTGARAD